MKRQSNLLLAAAIAAVLLPQAQSYAQAPVIEEIIVTAERRATTEQTTAISMNVLTSEDLASNGTKTVVDLQQTTPNLTINSSGGYNAINIRGVGNSANQPTITTGVAVLQDGLLNAETITLGNQFLDLGTIEVLRGPQGTFVGASSTGGAIRLNSVKPDLSGKVSGYLEGLVGMKSDTKITGAVNLPISDTMAARVAYNSEKRDSYFENRGGVVTARPANPMRRPGSVDDMNARVSLLWQPNENFEAIWRSEINRSDNQGTAGQPNPRLFTSAAGTPTHSRYWNYDAPADPNHDPKVLSTNSLDSQFITNVDRHSLEMNYKFDSGLTLRSLSGVAMSENLIMEDTDSSTASASMFRTDTGPNNNSYTQEINLISPAGPFNWILGASLFYRATPAAVMVESTTCGIDPATGQDVVNPFTGQVVPCPAQFSGTVPGLTSINDKSTTRSGGLFGQMNWKFIDTLELTAGVRWNVDRNFTKGQDYPGGTNPVLLTPPFPPVAAPCPADVQSIPRYAQVNWNVARCLFVGQNSKYEEETPTWKVGLNWTPDDTNFLYAFWSRGYKAGGVAPGGRFEAEEVDDYELGWKGTFADGRTQLSLGGFYMNYNDMQQQAFKANTIAAGNNVVNVGESTIKGLEAELNTRLGGFFLQASVGWVDSKLGTIREIDRTSALDSAVRTGPTSNTDLPQCAPGVVPPVSPTSTSTCIDWTPYYRTVSGENNLFSPELQYTASLSYDILAGNGTWTPRASYSHTDEQDTNLLRREEFWSIPERDLLNLSLTYTMNAWLVQAYCNNCTDKTYIAAIGTGIPGNNSVIYGNPLNYGVRVRYTF